MCRISTEAIQSCFYSHRTPIGDSVTNRLPLRRRARSRSVQTADRGLNRAWRTLQRQVGENDDDRHLPTEKICKQSRECVGVGSPEGGRRTSVSMGERNCKHGNCCCKKRTANKRTNSAVPKRMNVGRSAQSTTFRPNSIPIWH